MDGTPAVDSDVSAMRMRLASITEGHYYPLDMTWKSFVKYSPDHTIISLAQDIGNASMSVRTLSILQSVTGGYYENCNVFGRKGLTPNSQRYVEHGLATIDTALELSVLTRETLLRRFPEHYVSPFLRHSYTSLIDPKSFRKMEHMTDHDERIANVFCLDYALKFDRNDIEYAADHWQIIRQHLSIIIERQDVSRAFLEQLVSSNPAPALGSGIL